MEEKGEAEKEGKKESSKLRWGVLNAYLNNGWIFSNIAVEEKTTSKNSMRKPKQKFDEEKYRVSAGKILKQIISFLEKI